MDFVASDILWQVYNSAKTTQNRCAVVTYSSTHAGASPELWYQRHLRTVRSGPDQAHRLPGAPDPGYERASIELGRTSHTLLTA